MSLRARLLGAMVLGTLVGVGAALAFRDPWLELLGAAVGLAIAIAAGELLARAIGRPIREMTQTAESLRHGALSQRVRSRREDELGALGHAIDEMADQLAERFDVAHREEGRLRTILDAMVEGVFVTGPDGRIVLTNAALSALIGDVEGRSAIEAVRSPQLHEAVQRALQGEAAEVHLELGAHGLPRSITAHLAPLPKGAGVIAVLHDVTLLLRADAIRRDFVANASHELRTPLTSIRGFAETLLDGALDDPRTAKRFVGSIAENAGRLQELVEDLLELSRAEAPEREMKLDSVDLAAIAAHVLTAVEQRAAAKKQRLALEGEGVVAEADPRALEQVLLNLVDNAIKYTPDGGRIRVCVAQRDGRALVEVVDDGPGIPSAHLDRIFERFYRIDKGRARAQGGTGLGLSIVKHLVQRMNGEVTVESRVGQGTRFRVSLAAG